jgi:hypothetical protein
VPPCSVFVCDGKREKRVLEEWTQQDSDEGARLITVPLVTEAAPERLEPRRASGRAGCKQGARL